MIDLLEKRRTEIKITLNILAIVLSEIMAIFNDYKLGCDNV